MSDVIEKPEVWMIAITDNPISEYYRVRMTKNWEQQGFKVNHFEAVVPETIKDQPGPRLRFGSKVVSRTKSFRRFTPTEKAVWYSHIKAWKLCVHLNKPIIVSEHDVRPTTHYYDKFPLEEVCQYDICCLAHDKQGRTIIDIKGKPYRFAYLAGGAYYIKPAGALKLLEAPRLIKKVQYNSDGWIHRTCDKYGNFLPMACIQFRNPKVGYTIEHGRK